MLKLSGFKFAKDSSKIKNGEMNQEFVKERMAIARAFYSIYQRTDLTEEPNDVPFEWGDSSGQLFRKQMLRHLIRVIVLCPTSISYFDMLQHPFFFTVERFIAIEDRLRTYCSKYQMYDHYWDSTTEIVFIGEWTDLIDVNVAAACMKGDSPPSKKTFTGLWMARRNRRHHHDSDEKPVKKAMGRLPSENFYFWENTFPRFHLHLFLCSLTVVTFGSRFYTMWEFQDYYKASASFYKGCMRIPID